MDQDITDVRKVELEQSEAMLRKSHATYPLLWFTGDLYLTSRRLIWIAHRFNFPWFKPKRLSLRLSDIDDCYVDVLLFLFPFLVVRAGGQEYGFRLYRWIGPMIGWVGLSREFAEAINIARRRATEDSDVV